jgi:hypothetical protein
MCLLHGNLPQSLRQEAAGHKRELVSWDTRVPVESLIPSNGGRDVRKRTTEESAQTDRKVLSWMEMANLRRLANKTESSYFLLQPLLHLIRALWLGARSVFKHRRVPLHYFLPFLFLRFFSPRPL